VTIKITLPLIKKMENNPVIGLLLLMQVLSGHAMRPVLTTLKVRQQIEGGSNFCLHP